MKVSFYQCQVCGYTHKEKYISSDDELYIEIQCPRCRDVTKHIDCGETEIDIYKNYNCNLDNRFFTKQND